MQIRDQGKRLPKSVDVRSFNRPVKIAFLVPSEETHTAQWILDGIFYEAYTRWGGSCSLIIPFHDGVPLHEDYILWLSYLDPDFVYSYVDLDNHMISKINTASMPIRMDRHRINGEPGRWRDFLPQWPHGFEPVKSISTLASPFANYFRWNESPSPQTYLTQWYEVDEKRFLPDNFGVAYDAMTGNYGKYGIFETLSYCSDEIPKNNTVGNYRSADLTDILEKISSKKLRTFAHLAAIHTEGINHPSDIRWDNSFQLFIGDTVNTRINFWNSRNLSRSFSEHDFSSLIVSSTQLDDDKFCIQLGHFLNKHNFKGANNGPANTSIHSFEIDKENCQKIVDKLQPMTWTNVYVKDMFDQKVLPDSQSFKNYSPHKGTTCPSFKINDTSHKYIAYEPEHFRYLAPNFLYAKRGQWLVELQIERHQGDSKFDNVLNDWILPRRYEIVKTFTNNMGKIAKSLNLIVIPFNPKQLTFGGDSSNGNEVKLFIPENDTILRNLILKVSARFDDMRSCLNRDNKYEDLVLSDKGKNHRGVVALFGNSVLDASILTNSYWRKIIRDSHVGKDSKNSISALNELVTFVDEMKSQYGEGNENSLDILTTKLVSLKKIVKSYSGKEKEYSLDALNAIVDKYTPDDLENLIKQMGFINFGDTKKYLKVNLKDTIENLVHKGVLRQLYSWSCKYCGSRNKRSLDLIKLENYCDVCQNEHQVPIDMKWKYSVSPFVVSSLVEANGLTVLWAVYILLEQSRSQQSIYLPEVDLYPVYDADEKNEIDLIALIDGKLTVAEVKMSAASFINSSREAEIFLDELERIQPDIACLIFEQYCANKEEEGKYKSKLEDLIKDLKTKVPQMTELKFIVAMDNPDFADIPLELGPYGDRTFKLLDSLKY